MSRPIKRSVTIAGHSTSVSLEAEFWDALKTIARRNERSVADILREVDAGRDDVGLSTAARIYALTYFRVSPEPSDEPSR
ncbi:MAG: ribbon-helix-helix domain-containing protein [Hyphomicrobiales bacterium]